MREIKFRIWNTLTKDMIYNIRLGIWMGSDEGAMQYTGLKDRLGKEIYEGDIVEFWPLKRYEKSNLVGMVEFYDSEARFRIIEKSEIGENYWGFQQCEKFYVIGNIYENPNLL